MDNQDNKNYAYLPDDLLVKILDKVPNTVDKMNRMFDVQDEPINEGITELKKQNLTDSEFQLEKIYMSLRSTIGLNINSFEENNASLANVAKKWEQKGLAVVDRKQHLFLTSKGYLILDSLMNDLFNLKLIK